MAHVVAAMSVRELRQCIEDGGFEHTGVTEKSELRELAAQALQVTTARQSHESASSDTATSRRGHGAVEELTTAWIPLGASTERGGGAFRAIPVSDHADDHAPSRGHARPASNRSMPCLALIVLACSVTWIGATSFVFAVIHARPSSSGAAGEQLESQQGTWSSISIESTSAQLALISHEEGEEGEQEDEEGGDASRIIASSLPPSSLSKHPPPPQPQRVASPRPPPIASPPPPVLSPSPPVLSPSPSSSPPPPSCEWAARGAINLHAIDPLGAGVKTYCAVYNEQPEECGRAYIPISATPGRVRRCVSDGDGKCTRGALETCPPFPPFPPPSPLPPVRPAGPSPSPPPLPPIRFTTSNGVILANGAPFHIKGVNVVGTEGRAGPPLGLDKHPFEWYCKFLRRHGFNAIRLLFNHELILRRATLDPPNTAWCAEHGVAVCAWEAPELEGSTYIDMFAHLAEVAARHGMLVLMACHRLTPSAWPGHGLWYDASITEVLHPRSPALSASSLHCISLPSPLDHVLEYWKLAH